MVIIGSSAISPLPGFGPTGSTGPTGATGNAPIYGGSAGFTGTTGATGTYVVSGHRDEESLYLVLSDGRTLEFLNLKGPDGATGGKADGVTLGSGETILRDVLEGMTFTFKGISASGSLAAYGTRTNTIAFAGSGPPEMIQLAQTGDQNNLNNFTFAYLKEANIAESAGVAFDNNGTMVFGTGPSGIYGDSITFDPEEIIIQVPPVDRNEIVTIYGHECIGDCGQTAGMGVGIQLAVTAGSIYEVQTPIGIAGITGSFKDDELFGFSMILHGNNVWELPDNVLYSQDNNAFSCGTDIMNLITHDGGGNWYATITSSGYGVSDCGDGGPNVFGSCCYEKDDESKACVEYTTEQECDELYNSTFHPLSDCSNCEQEFGGICCSQGNDDDPVGNCISGVSREECEYFNGQFYTHYTYVEKDPVNDIFQMQELDEPMVIECGGHLPCYSIVDGMQEPAGITWSCMENAGSIIGFDGIPNNLCVGCNCDNFVACCKNGSCIGDSSGTGNYGPMSAVVCRYIHGGVPVAGQCGEFDCCDETIYEGACCIKDHPIFGETCIQTTYYKCLNGFEYFDGGTEYDISGGVFMGPNTKCEDINCCFGGDNPDGSFCEDNSDCESLCCVENSCSPTAECIQCLDGSDCPSGCCLNNICMDDPSACSCMSDADCPGTCNKCVSGTCVFDDCGDCYCVLDSQCTGSCGTGSCCVDGSCTNDCDVDECQYDSDCPGTCNNCVGGNCVFDACENCPCTTGADCTGPCGTGHCCVDGSCTDDCGGGIVGACCWGYDTGSPECLPDVEQAVCIGMPGGDWLGEGIDCSGDPCGGGSGAEGACCRPGGSNGYWCDETLDSQLDCEQWGGYWHPDETCATVDCDLGAGEDEPGACCLVKEEIVGCCCSANSIPTEMDPGYRPYWATKWECEQDPLAQSWDPSGDGCRSGDTHCMGSIIDWNCLVVGDGCDPDNPCKRNMCCCSAETSSGCSCGCGYGNCSHREPGTLNGDCTPGDPNHCKNWLCRSGCNLINYGGDYSARIWGCWCEQVNSCEGFLPAGDFGNNNCSACHDQLEMEDVYRCPSDDYGNRINTGYWVKCCYRKRFWDAWGWGDWPFGDEPCGYRIFTSRNQTAVCPSEKCYNSGGTMCAFEAACDDTEDAFPDNWHGYNYWHHYPPGNYPNDYLCDQCCSDPDEAPMGGWQTGACCSHGDFCTDMMTQYECGTQGHGGTWGRYTTWHHNLMCADISCDVEPPPSHKYDCVDVDGQQSCLDLGGPGYPEGGWEHTYLKFGPGRFCEEDDNDPYTDECPDGMGYWVGACCLSGSGFNNNNDGCLVLSSDECQEENGTWYGPGTCCDVTEDVHNDQDIPYGTKCWDGESAQDPYPSNPFGGWPMGLVTPKRCLGGCCVDGLDGENRIPELCNGHFWGRGNYLGETTPDGDDVTCVGACCLESSGCETRNVNSCSNLDGLFLGYQTCGDIGGESGDPCYGTCCKDDGTCMDDTNMINCSRIGTFVASNWEGTPACVATDPRCLGACCTRDGCQLLSKNACLNGDENGGWIWNGVGSICYDAATAGDGGEGSFCVDHSDCENNCCINYQCRDSGGPEEGCPISIDCTGVCCHEDNGEACDDTLTRLACEDLNGFFGGEGVKCIDIVSDESVVHEACAASACCLDVDTCLDDITPWECSGLGGIWKGPRHCCYYGNAMMPPWMFPDENGDWPCPSCGDVNCGPGTVCRSGGIDDGFWPDCPSQPHNECVPHDPPLAPPASPPYSPPPQPSEEYNERMWSNKDGNLHINIINDLLSTTKQVQLPNGKCVWMKCGEECPYQPCPNN
jgi:hypothetical protein